VRLKAEKKALTTAINHISIPFGAIKRQVVWTAFARYNIFQFLSVRLKVFVCTCYAYSFNISIPFGAIKSTYEVSEEAMKVKFQFLSVRLKV